MRNSFRVKRGSFRFKGLGGGVKVNGSKPGGEVGKETPTEDALLVRRGELFEGLRMR